MLGDAVDHEHQRDHHQHEANHQPGEPFDSAFEGRFDLLAGDAFSHFAEIGLRAGGHDDRRRRAAFHAGAEKAKVRMFDGEYILTQLPRFSLFHRQRFAGQRRLDDEQIFG